MKCFLVAFNNGGLVTFLSKATGGETDIRAMCAKRGILDEPSDWLAIESGVPEPAALESYFVERGKIKFDQKKFCGLKFLEADSKVIGLLEKNNRNAINFYRGSGNQRFLSLCEKNGEYLRGLTSGDIYSGGGKVNMFFNIVGFDVVDPGEGYSKPPTMTVSEPQNSSNHKIKEIIGVGGRKVQFSIVQRNNIIKSIDVTRWGTGYVDPPKIDFSDPDEENGRKPTVNIITLNNINI